MPGDLLLAIDQGTSNTKAIVIDRQGQIVAKASLPMEIAFPRPGWVEQDPLAIWKAVQVVVDGCLEQVSADRLTAIGISNQRETILAWDRSSGEPLGPAVIWQCRRTADFCQHLREQGLEPFLRERTGLTIDPLFSASKGRWLLKQIEARGRSADEFALAPLTAGFFGTSPVERFMPRTTATLHAHSSSTCEQAHGTMSSRSFSRFPSSPYPKFYHPQQNSGKQNR